MEIYTPDVWKVIRITTPEYGVTDKVLAGWYGGFAGANSWKLNSGITATREFDDRYEFVGYSGSTYVCYKAVERFSSLTSSIFQSLQDQASTSGREISFEVLDYEEKQNVTNATDQD
jgi:hypothetical protein